VVLLLQGFRTVVAGHGPIACRQLIAGLRHHEWSAGAARDRTASQRWLLGMS
jgi:hypothetical protein